MNNPCLMKNLPSLSKLQATIDNSLKETFQKYLCQT